MTFERRSIRSRSVPPADGGAMPLMTFPRIIHSEYQWEVVLMRSRLVCAPLHMSAVGGRRAPQGGGEAASVAAAKAPDHLRVVGQAVRKWSSVSSCAKHSGQVGRQSSTPRLCQSVRAPKGRPFATTPQANSLTASITSKPREFAKKTAGQPPLRLTHPFYRRPTLLAGEGGRLSLL